MSAGISGAEWDAANTRYHRASWQQLNSEC